MGLARTTDVVRVVAVARNETVVLLAPDGGADERVAAHLDGKSVKKSIFVQDRLLNLVVA